MQFRKCNYLGRVNRDRYLVFWKPNICKVVDNHLLDDIFNLQFLHLACDRSWVKCNSRL